MNWILFWKLIDLAAIQIGAAADVLGPHVYISRPAPDVNFGIATSLRNGRTYLTEIQSKGLSFVPRFTKPVDDSMEQTIVADP